MLFERSLIGLGLKTKIIKFYLGDLSINSAWSRSCHWTACGL